MTLKRSVAWVLPKIRTRRGFLATQRCAACDCLSPAFLGRRWIGIARYCGGTHSIKGGLKGTNFEQNRRRKRARPPLLRAGRPPCALRCPDGPAPPLVDHPVARAELRIVGQKVALRPPLLSRHAQRDHLREERQEQRLADGAGLCDEAGSSAGASPCGARPGAAPAGGSPCCPRRGCAAPAGRRRCALLRAAGCRVALAAHKGARPRRSPRERALLVPRVVEAGGAGLPGKHLCGGQVAPVLLRVL